MSDADAPRTVSRTVSQRLHDHFIVSCGTCGSENVEVVGVGGFHADGKWYESAHIRCVICANTVPVVEVEMF